MVFRQKFRDLLGRGNGCQKSTAVHYSRFPPALPAVYVGLATVAAATWWFLYDAEGPHITFYQLVSKDGQGAYWVVSEVELASPSYWCSRERGLEPYGWPMAVPFQPYTDTHHLRGHWKHRDSTAQSQRSGHSLSQSSGWGRPRGRTAQKCLTFTGEPPKH